MSELAALSQRIGALSNRLAAASTAGDGDAFLDALSTLSLLARTEARRLLKQLEAQDSEDPPRITDLQTRREP